MWRQLLRCRRSSCALLRRNSSDPVSKQLSMSSCHFLRNSQKNTNEKDSVIKSEGTQEEHIEVAEQYTKENVKELFENAISGEESEPIIPDDVWSDGPYPKNSNVKQSQAKFSIRPAIDPKQTSIIMFPGQGEQFVGMGREVLDYPNVKEMYEVASQILGYDLLDISLNGPAEQLNKTIYQQPAIVVASLAAVEKLREEHPESLEMCVGVAGFSVGEITALTFAGVFSFEDAIRLVKVRAEAMQYASEITPSGMMTVLYRPDSRVGFALSVAKEYCKRKELEHIDCRVASYLYPHCKVIAGNDEALEFIDVNKNDFNLKRLIRLPVSGAFHTDLMRPAVGPIRKILEKISLNPPLVPVHSNIDGKSYKNVAQIKKQLPMQVYSPVKWEQTMHILFERNSGIDFPNSYACGSNKSLKTILKMCNSKAFLSCKNINV